MCWNDEGRTIEAIAFWNELKCHLAYVHDQKVPLYMAAPPIPEDIRRFVLTSIPTVPHLEALLLLRAAAPACCTVSALAERLYIGDKLAQSLLTDLHGSNMVASSEGGYCYQPGTPTLAQTIDDLAALYGRRLVDVTNLIHSRLDRKAQQFADAFKWRKDD